MELGHHPFHKGKTYEEEIGNRALSKKGRKKWNELAMEASPSVNYRSRFTLMPRLTTARHSRCVVLVTY